MSIGPVRETHWNAFSRSTHTKVKMEDLLNGTLNRNLLKAGARSELVQSAE